MGIMKRFLSFAALLVLVSIVFVPGMVYGAIYIVPDDAATIQEALDLAESLDTVIVRDDVYAGPGNRNLDFQGKAITLRSENGAANCIIDCEGSGRGFYFHSGETSSSVVDGFTIINGVTIYSGPFPNGWGGAILCVDSSSPTITNCVIKNSSAFSGGGIECYSYCSPTISNCLILANTAQWGGGITCNFSSSPTITNCTFSGNTAQGGGGIYTANLSWPIIINSIMWNDSASYGPELGVVQDADLTVSYSDVQGGRAGAFVGTDSVLHLGGGNFSSNPFFVSGPLGICYLAQIAAGHRADSPCINAGNDSAANLGLDLFTTRTDHIGDAGTVDLGFHYQIVPLTELTQINCTFPANESTLDTAPTFVWTPDGGMDNVFVVDMALSLSGPVFTTPVIHGTSWTMPTRVWDLVPEGSFVYWRVRGADLYHSPLTIIASDEIWRFYKP